MKLFFQSIHKYSIIYKIGIFLLNWSSDHDHRSYYSHILLTSSCVHILGGKSEKIPISRIYRFSDQIEDDLCRLSSSEHVGYNSIENFKGHNFCTEHFSRKRLFFEKNRKTSIRITFKPSTRLANRLGWDKLLGPCRAYFRREIFALNVFLIDI